MTEQAGAPGEATGDEPVTPVPDATFIHDPQRTTARFDDLGSTAVNPAAPPVRLGSADAAAVEALPPGSALMIVQYGPNAGARFLLNADRTSVGRDPRADIFLDDVTVSRKHAEFRRGESGFEVRDVGSLNGTYLNRERIDSAPLRLGDEVQIGKFRLTFHTGPVVRAEDS